MTTPTQPTLTSSTFSSGSHNVLCFFATRFILLVLGLACLAAPTTGKNVTITMSNVQLSGAEWRGQDGGHKAALDVGATATATFKGSAIYWLSSIDPIGAKAFISIDGEASTTVDQSENAQGLTRGVGPEVLFGRTGLDGTKEHTIQVSYGGQGQMGGSYLDVWGFTYDDSPGQQAPQAPQTTPDQPQTTPGTQTVTQTAISTVVQTSEQSKTTQPPPTSPITSSQTTTDSPTTSPGPSQTSTPTSTTTSVTSNTPASSSVSPESSTSHQSSVFRSTTVFVSGSSTITRVLTPVTGISGGVSVTVTETGTASGSTTTETLAGASTTSDKSRNGVIGGVVGGVIGGVLAAILLVLFILAMLRRRRAQKKRKTIDFERKPRPYSEMPSTPVGEVGEAGVRPSNPLVVVDGPHPPIAGSTRDNGTILSSSVGAQRQSAVPLRVVGSEYADHHDAYDGVASSSASGPGSSTLAITPIAPGKVAAAARARVLAGQAPEPYAAPALRSPPIPAALTYSSPEDRYTHAGAGTARLSSAMSLPDVAPPLYSE